jgi:hypothetical protein
MKGEISDGEARDRLIIWIRLRMEEYAITPEALAASVQYDLDDPPLYRDAKGNEWDGHGNMPDWLSIAKRAGVDPEFFRIESKVDHKPGVTSGRVIARARTSLTNAQQGI